MVFGAAGLLAGLGLSAMPGLGPVVAARWLAATAVRAAAGAATRGIVGALTQAGVLKEDAPLYAEGSVAAVPLCQPVSQMLIARGLMISLVHRLKSPTS